MTSSRSEWMPPATATPSGFFVMRAPLWPYDALVALGEGLEAGSADAPRRADALARDRARIRSRLRDALARPELREAIFLASPGLEARLGTWDRDPDSRRGRQIERALLCYLARAAGRPAPFGLFAATSVGAIGDHTELVVDELESSRRHTRLRIDDLVALAEGLGRRRDVRARARIEVNPTLYRASERLRFAALQLTGTIRAYRLVAADSTPYLEATLARAARGARIADLAQALVDDDPEIALEDAEAYVHELVDAQLLIASLGPRVTGGEPTSDLCAQVRAHPALAGTVARLEQAQQRLTALDAGGPGASPTRYRDVMALLDGLLATAAPFHVELTRTARRLTLGRDAVTEVLRGVEVLRRLSPPSRNQRSLRRFVEAFATRYGDAEVPLLEALDEDSGIGFDGAPGGAAPAPLLHGVRISAEEPVAQFGARDALWLRRIEEARRHGHASIRLMPDELRALSTPDPLPLPTAFFAVARLAARSQQALSDGDFTVVLDSAAAPSEPRLLGVHDAALRARLAEHLRAEQAARPDAVFAEIVHLPEAATGDELVRPVLRGHEIPIVGRSGAPDECQLPLGDLVVSIDRAEQIVVRSRRLGRDVLPRLTAPVHSPALGVYRFLCALQYQGTAADLAFRWGTLEALAFLPRVVVGRVVLARARWRLAADALRGLATAGARFHAVLKLRAEHGIPRRVEVGEDERWLTLDLDNVVCVDALAHIAMRRAQLVLREELPSFDELCATGPEGRFVHELVIPFVRSDPPRASEPIARHAPAVHRFLPGSEWLQIDVFTGIASADRVLTEVVAPWIADAMTRAAADRWFFLRYAEGGPHGSQLRVRVHGDPARLLVEVFPALEARAAALVEQGVIWNVALDRYQRETERYGGPAGIEIAEHMFHADSDAVAAILAQLGGDDGEVARWQLTLRGIDVWLDDLGLDRAAKLAVVRHGKAKLVRMLQAQPALDHQLGAAYRRQRAPLTALLDPARDATNDLAPALAQLHQRSARLAPWVHELRARERKAQLTQPIADMAWSFVHMFTNRMFRSVSLAQELVLYDWLRRAYESALARERRGD